MRTCNGTIRLLCLCALGLAVSTSPSSSAHAQAAAASRGVRATVNRSATVAVTVFPSEQYQAPRSWTERAYPRLIYYNRVDKGGHFAAWEQPELLAQELRAAFKSLR